ncbi:MAG: CU044_5270 family protein [Solirubrobacteraceae bacterium]
MPDRRDPSLDLPILDELGTELSRAFTAHEASSTPDTASTDSASLDAWQTLAGSPTRNAAPTLVASPTAEGDREHHAAAPPAPDAAPPSHAARRARGRPRPLLQWSVLGVVVAGVVAIVVAVSSGIGEGELGPSDASARAVLDRAATTAERQAAVLPPRADEYWFRDEVNLNAAIDGDMAADDLRAATSFEMSRRRTWSSPDRPSMYLSRTFVRTKGGAAPPALRTGEDDRHDGAAVPLPVLRPDDPGTGRQALGRTPYVLGTALTREELLAYPTGPEAIRRRLAEDVADTGRSPNGAIWVAINDALPDVPLPPRLAAGMYRTLGRLPGVRLGGRTVDRLGRPALQITYQEPGTWERDVLLLDPDSYARLGDRSVVTRTAGTVPAGVPATVTTAADGTTGPTPADPRSPYPPGTITGESLVLKTGVTDRIEGPLRGR